MYINPGSSTASTVESNRSVRRKRGKKGADLPRIAPYCTKRQLHLKENSEDVNDRLSLKSPRLLRAVAELGIEVSELYSKPISEFAVTAVLATDPLNKKAVKEGAMLADKLVRVRYVAFEQRRGELINMVIKKRAKFVADDDRAAAKAKAAADDPFVKAPPPAVKDDTSTMLLAAQENLEKILLNEKRREDQAQRQMMYAEQSALLSVQKQEQKEASRAIPQPRILHALNS